MLSVDAIVVNNGSFSWGTTGDDVEVLKKYVSLIFVTQELLVRRSLSI